MALKRAQAIRLLFLCCIMAETPVRAPQPTNLQMIRVFVCLSCCDRWTPVVLLNCVPSLISVMIDPLVLVVLYRVLMTGSLWSA